MYKFWIILLFQNELEMYKAYMERLICIFQAIFIIALNLQCSIIMKNFSEKHAIPDQFCAIKLEHRTRIWKYELRRIGKKFLIKLELQATKHLSSIFSYICKAQK